MKYFIIIVTLVIAVYGGYLIGDYIDHQISIILSMAWSVACGLCGAKIAFLFD